MSRYVIRIFAWENVRPSKVLTNFVSTGAMPFLASSTELVRHFLPADTSDQDAMCAADTEGRCIGSSETYHRPSSVVVGAVVTAS